MSEKLYRWGFAFIVGLVIGGAGVTWLCVGRIDEAQRASEALGNRLEIVQGELEQSRADQRRLASEINDAVSGIDRSLERIETIDELIATIEAFLFRLASLDRGEF